MPTLVESDLCFVAGGAVLGFVIVHGDFEHVVAADADAVDLGAGFRVMGGRTRMMERRIRVPGWLRGLLMRFGHERILA
jgi:hypothetical protein